MPDAVLCYLDVVIFLLSALDWLFYWRSGRVYLKLRICFTVEFYSHKGTTEDEMRDILTY
jgi:hypothetical protein